MNLTKIPESYDPDAPAFSQLDLAEPDRVGARQAAAIAGRARLAQLTDWIDQYGPDEAALLAGLDLPMRSYVRLVERFKRAPKRDLPKRRRR